MLFQCILSSLLVFVFTATVPQQKPTFCHDLDCPNFTTVQSFKDYELRKYDALKWVATNVTTMEYTDDINREMFFRLFYYISGNNSAAMKIPMTAPVLRTVIHGQGPTCEATFITHFMIPHNMQTNTPTPTDPKAYLVTIPGKNFYVKSFPGRPTDQDFVEKVEELAQEIGNPNLYLDNYYFTASYDGPYAIHRHNEVWLESTSGVSRMLG
ncbi:Hypothetical predicted protein [Mytilus galloprovincialis]|uniref:Heme-binding protein 2-like n=1 Tax=Mytilus galloprovincialis TaxID=29158 RepID=A0A8B6H0X7_MYTGA|nr:Hypothetical predicted protein [Mytilus galloprovincialis]